MMPFKKTCLWQGQDSAITMYLKRNFWAPLTKQPCYPSDVIYTGKISRLYIKANFDFHASYIFNLWGGAYIL